MKNLEEIANAIQSESERACVERIEDELMMLTATVEGGKIIVSDGNAVEEYTGDLAGVPDFVWDWHQSQIDNA